MRKSQSQSFILIATLAVQCSPATQNFNNPNDPNSTAATTQSAGTASSASPTSSGGVSAPGAGGSSGKGTSSAPTGSVYDFSNQIILTPSGCSDVSQVHLFDTGSALIVFLGANCGSQTAVYSLSTSYSGGSPTTPINLTSDCGSGTSGVSDYSVDQGADGFLVAYVCKTLGATAYNVKVLPVSTAGAPGTPALYESSTHGSYLVAWNGTANAFGVLRQGQFQRFNQSGSMVGGPVAALGVSNGGTGNSPALLFASGGNWFAVSTSGAGASYGSKINSSGSLQCDDVALGSSTLYAKVQATLSASTTTVIDSENGIAPLQISSTDCSGGDSSPPLDPTNAVSEGLSGVQISPTIDAFTYKTNNSLVVATFSASGTPLYAENSVTGFSTSLGSADTKIINGKIYTSYDKDGGGYISYSTQSVP